MPVSSHSGKEFSFIYDSAKEFEDFAKGFAGFPFSEVDME
jgi:hypothetical protein